MSKLFSELDLNYFKLKNRLVLSPMCQYSAVDGFANNWHLVHLGSRAVGGFGVIMQEATAVSPEGRITYADLGIWEDAHVSKLTEIVDFVHQQNAKIGIQLAHAGRKGSCEKPWLGGRQIKEGTNHWINYSSSSKPFREDEVAPKELSETEIQKVVQDFYKATERAIRAGYDIIELHAAHGYLVHQFLSPLINERQDQYGGSFENRIRFLLEILEAIVPLVKKEKKSLWVRISATDWMENGWDLPQSVELAKILHEKGVEVIDVSSGGAVPHAQIKSEPNYQVPFAEAIKKESGLITGSVGLILNGTQAEDILQNDRADLIFIGRAALDDPYFAQQAALDLDGEDFYPSQYIRKRETVKKH